ncbi:hypothetical protein [Brevibacillus fulvus]|uniref:Uncharacterized protein n=1 Tax=Brevibacillus fulvus TaxID=1125967 RepID=A0A938Y4Q3_9BACL|nr:hypothetical protein [Brevibacillus fulvus]MBM7592259.1 hypothetical protein [Brevibacillus fulvus]
MNFKDYVAQDTRLVFFNPDEFGEIHHVGGRDICIVIDHEELTRRKANTTNPDDGIHDAEILFYAKREDFAGRPAIDGFLTMDGKQYRVTSVQEDAFSYTIALAATRS